VPAGRHIDDLRIRGIHRDALDTLGFIEAQMSPGFPAVGGAPDAVADRRTLAIVALAHADVHNVGVRRRDADGADRSVRLFVKQ